MDMSGIGIANGTYTAGNFTGVFFGPLTGNVTGNLTGNMTGIVTGSLTGNASTATALQTGRTINGVTFDGTSNITVTAAAGTLSGSALNAGVTSAPGLTSAAVGTFNSLATQSSSAIAVTGGTMNAVTITGLPAPVNPYDAARLTDLSSVSAGITQRTGVAVATTANITLSGEQTIDTFTTSASRVAVINQSTTSQNGIYVSAAGAWSRASDSNTAAQLKVGYLYFVSGGSVNKNTSWAIQTAPTVLGTDPVIFAQFGAASSYTAGTNLALIGNVFSIPATITSQTINSGVFNGTLGQTTPAVASVTQLTNTGNTFAANLVLKTNQIAETTTNANGSVNVNFDGYNGGTTQFRDFNVYDGKNNAVVNMVGSTKAVTFAGAVAVPTLNGNTFTAGSYTLTGTAAKTLNFTNSLTLSGTDGTSHTFPTTNSVLARTDAAQTFTGHQTFSNGFTIPQITGTTGVGNSASVGQEISFLTFVNGTTTGVSLPSAVNGDSFMLYFQGCNATSTVTFSGASVFREGDPDVAIAGGVYTPGPAGNHSARLKLVNSRWMLSDDSYQATYVADSGSTNTYVMTLAPAITTYTTGTPLYTFVAANANTSASTLNINALGAKTLKKAVGGVNTDLAANDIRAGQVVVVAYDGTNFQVVSALGNGGGGGTGTSVTRAVSQANSFTVGQCVFNNGSAWVLSDNAASGTAVVDGVVTGTGNPFTVTMSGFENVISSLAANTQYYLGTSGALTSTAPVTTTSFLVQVLHTGAAADGTIAISSPASLAKINLTTDVGGVLPPANGGTNSAFFSATGLTAVRAFTFPDAAATIARTDASQTFIGTETINGAIHIGVTSTSSQLDTGTLSFTDASGASGSYAKSSFSLRAFGAAPNIIFGIGGTTETISLTSSSGNPIFSVKFLDTLAFDTLAHQRTGKANLNLTINVKDYGALGNGSDDTTAIQAAVSALPANYGILYFPAGNYVFNTATAGLVTFTGHSNTTICGDGVGVTILQGISPGQTIKTDTTTDHITICNLTVDGGCTARTTGAHALQLQGSFPYVHDVEIKHSGEFAIFAVNATDVRLNNISTSVCYADGIHLSGCTRGTVYNCHLVGQDDDGYGIDTSTDITVEGGLVRSRDYGQCLTTANGAGGSPNDYLPSYAFSTTTTSSPASGTFRLNNATPSSATNIYINDTDSNSFSLASVYSGLVSGNIVVVNVSATRLTNYQTFTMSGSATHSGSVTTLPVTYLGSGGTGTSGIANTTACNIAPASTWGRGIWLAGDTDVLVNGVNIDTVKQSGVRGEINSSTRNTRVKLLNVKVRNSSTVGGGHGIWFVNSTDCTIKADVDDIASGSCLVIADWQNLTVEGCHLSQGRAQFCRGIDTGTDISSPTAWNGLKLIGNSINLLSASNNESVRLVPNSAVTLTNTAIVGTVSSQASGGNYIITDYTAAPTKVTNNVSMDGLSIADGGHGTPSIKLNNN